MTIRILLTALIVFSASSAGKESIVWGTDSWDNFTETNGKGLYHDLITHVFPPGDYAVKLEYMNWVRVVRAIEDGDVEMTGALPETDSLYLSQQPVLSEKILLVRRKGSHSYFTNDNLRRLTGTWRKGYRKDIVEKAITQHVAGSGVDSPRAALKLLNLERVDFYIDIESVVYPAIKQNSDLYQIDEIGYYNLYWAFTKTKKGLQLKQTFDDALTELAKNGELASLYKAYGIKPPVWENAPNTLSVKNR